MGWPLSCSFIHGAPVILAILDAVDSARADSEILDCLDCLKSDVRGGEVTRRELGQLGRTCASILRLVLLDKHDGAVIHSHVNINYVVDEIFRRIDDNGHLRSRITNREIGERSAVEVEDQPEGCD